MGEDSDSFMSRTGAADEVADLGTSVCFEERSTTPIRRAEVDGWVRLMNLRKGGATVDT
jgi:hypothetical protein